MIDEARRHADALASELIAQSEQLSRAPPEVLSQHDVGDGASLAHHAASAARRVHELLSQRPGQDSKAT